MDEEPQGESPLFERAFGVFETRLELIDLGDDASFFGDLAGKLGVVSGFVERNVDIVPWAGLGHFREMFVGPV